MMGQGTTNGNDWSRAPPTNAHIVYKIGIYGWRKRCLYAFVLLLLITVVLNLALTVWILKVMDFSVSHGMGRLYITEEGVLMDGKTQFTKPLYTRSIRTYKNEPMNLESASNITLNARDEQGNIVNKLFIGDGKIESYSSKFEIKDRDGKSLFMVDDKNISIGVDKLSVQGTEGALFKGSVRTPHIKAEADLTVESPSRGVKIFSAKDVKVSSSLGNITISSLRDIVLKSDERMVRLSAPFISMNKLPKSGVGDGTFYQLCICAFNDRVFLSPASGNCQATSDICMP